VQVQKQNYRYEKRRATNELLSVLKDPSIVIIADWLKVRGSLKSWTKLWCVLKPGILLLYKSDKAKVKYLAVTTLCRLQKVSVSFILDHNLVCFPARFWIGCFGLRRL